VIRAAVQRFATVVFPDLRGLLLKIAGLVDVLDDALRPVASKVVGSIHNMFYRPVFCILVGLVQRSSSTVQR